MLLLRWDTDEVKDRFCGMVRFEGGLRGKGRVHRVIIDVITEINYSCNYMQEFLNQGSATYMACEEG